MSTLTIFTLCFYFSFIAIVTVIAAHLACLCAEEAATATVAEKKTALNMPYIAFAFITFNRE